MNSLSIINIIINTDDFYFKVGLQFIIKHFFNKKAQSVSFLPSNKVDILIRFEHSSSLKEEGKEIIITERHNKLNGTQRVCTCRNIMFKHDTPAQFISILEETMTRTVTKVPCTLCRRKLTRREKEILSKLADGLTSSDISTSTGLNIKSVSQHKRNAMRKLSLRNTSELINWLLINKINI